MPTFPTLSACMGHWGSWQAWVATLAARGLTRLLLYFWASEIYREQQPGIPQTAEAIYGWCCAIAAYGDPVASTALASLPTYGPYEYSEAHALLAAVVMVVTLCILSAATYLKVMAPNNNETWTTMALKALCGLYGVACGVALVTGAFKDALPPDWQLFCEHLTQQMALYRVPVARWASSVHDANLSGRRIPFAVAAGFPIVNVP
ncbi:uncharacterized protein [Dermacentor andersoni]|uniref:uncharacterized protein n=1 Tax=Dermacentor andersoni TaxID=34620 RepID=UPI003B3A951B